MLFTCTLWLNLAWSVWMAAAFSVLYLLGPMPTGAVVLALAVLFVGLSVAALFRSRWSIALVVAVALLTAIRWAPLVAVNAWMFATDDPLYVNAPATIYIVATHAVLFAIPSLVLLVLYAAQWRTVSGLVRGRRAAASQGTPCRRSVETSRSYCSRSPMP